jgi:DnaJ like chaperone protein
MKYVITVLLILVLFYLIGNLSSSKNKKSGKTKKSGKVNMAKHQYAKWIGGGLGWALGGPIGGILGFMFGSMFDGMSAGTYTSQPTRTGDFSVSLLILSAAVMKADGKVMKSELNYVRTFFERQFGTTTANDRIMLLKKILEQDINVQDVSYQIRQFMEYPSRLQLLHYLFGLSSADGQYHNKEVEMIALIASYLGIDQRDLDSIRAMFVKDINSAYKVLEVNPDASDEEVKTAYRQMAVKYHPDKVAHLGEDIQNSAKEKFQQLNAAYEEIKKQRGIK